MARRSALRDQLDASLGLQLNTAVRSRQITSYTFTRNYEVLDALIRLHYQLQLKGELGDFNNREPLQNFLFELTRRLQNFVFAAKALVDHTRNYIENSHGGKPEIAKPYASEVHRHFGVSGVGAFTKDLRDFFAHCSTPFISSTTGSSEATGRELFTLQLDTREMERAGEFRGWSPPAKRYIAGHGGTNVALDIYTNDYYEAVVRFYSWFDEQNQEWCKAAWEESLAIQDEIEALERPRPAQFTDN